MKTHGQHPRYGLVPGSKARAFTTKHHEILLIGYIDTTMIRNTSRHTAEASVSAGVAQELFGASTA